MAFFCFVRVFCGDWANDITTMAKHLPIIPKLDCGRANEMAIIPIHMLMSIQA